MLKGLYRNEVWLPKIILFTDLRRYARVKKLIKMRFEFLVSACINGL